MPLSPISYLSGVHLFRVLSIHLQKIVNWIKLCTLLCHHWTCYFNLLLIILSLQKEQWNTSLVNILKVIVILSYVLVSIVKVNRINNICFNSRLLPHYPINQYGQNIHSYCQARVILKVNSQCLINLITFLTRCIQMWTQRIQTSFACKPEDSSSSKYYVNLRNVLRKAFNKKESVEIFQLFHSRSQPGLLDFFANKSFTHSFISRSQDMCVLKCMEEEWEIR